MTVLDLPRPTADAPASTPAEPTPAPTPGRLTWDDARRQPPSQHWCLRCAGWHGPGRAHGAPEGPDGTAA